MKKLCLIIAVGILVIGACFGVYNLEYFRRPMFHDYFGRHKSALVPYWRPNHGNFDRSGNYEFADFRTNMVVVIITGDTSDVFPFMPTRSKVDSAVLLRDSPYEVVVHPLRDTLLMIRGDERLSIPLDPGAAKNLNMDTANYGRKHDPPDLLKELVKHYQGNHLSRLKDFIEQDGKGFRNR